MIPFTDEELLPVVKQTLQKVRPMLQNDGGDMEFLGIKNAKVYVRFQGACHGCAASSQTLKFGIERQLKIDIHPDMEVFNIPKDVEFDLEDLPWIRTKIMVLKIF